MALSAVQTRCHVKEGLTRWRRVHLIVVNQRKYGIPRGGDGRGAETGVVADIATYGMNRGVMCCITLHQGLQTRYLYVKIDLKE